HRHVLGPVVMIVELGEQLAPDAKRRLAPGDLLRHFRQGETDRAQSLDRARTTALARRRATDRWAPRRRDLQRSGSALSILAHVSRSETARFHTGRPAAESHAPAPTHPPRPHLPPLP